MTAIAYLRTDCEHCTGHIEYPPELVGQSIACPHCGQTTGLSSPLGPKSQAPAETAKIKTRPLDDTFQGERVFCREESVVVTTSRVIAGAETYAIAGITSVRGVEVEPNRLPPIALLVFGLGIACIGIIGGRSLAALGLIMSAVALLLIFSRSPIYSVVLRTAGGELKAYSRTTGMP